MEREDLYVFVQYPFCDRMTRRVFDVGYNKVYATDSHIVFAGSPYWYTNSNQPNQLLAHAELIERESRWIHRDNLRRRHWT